MKNLLLLLLFPSLLSAQCGNGRYFSKLFNASQDFNVEFGRNAKYDGDSMTLRMHVFQPSGDNFARRPLIILAFGGSFTSGVKESPDILELCNEFAQRGYVTATIDYRTGVENGSDSARYKALIRGIQDMRSAIGFFYKDAWTSNTYRVDTNQIFIGGVSAGGFIGLNLAYYKENIFSIVPPPWIMEVANGVGGLYAQSGNEGYGQRVKGVINLCGGIADTAWLYPGDPILCSVHGTADSTVPYNYNPVPGDVTTLFFGSGTVHQRANHVFIPNALRTFYGADHVPFVLPIPLLPPASLYMDTTVKFVRDFLYQHVICDSTLVSVHEYESEPVRVFPNPVCDRLSVVLPDGVTYPVAVRVVSVAGDWVQSTNLTDQHAELALTYLSGGLYFVEVDLNGVTHRQKILKW